MHAHDDMNRTHTLASLPFFYILPLHFESDVSVSDPCIFNMNIRILNRFLVAGFSFYGLFFSKKDVVYTIHAQIREKNSAIYRMQINK